MKIGFHSYQLGGRGTEIALYDYAKYNQELLNNESIIVSTSSRGTPVIDRFKDFKVRLYPEVWQHSLQNDHLKNALSKIVSEEKLDVLYCLKGGENDNIMPTNCKTIAHCIFRTDQPHGDVYAGICEYICKKHNNHHPWVYHIVDKPVINGDLREELNIPKNALVFGRHGGFDTFNLPFVYNSIIKAVSNRSDAYFVFLGTREFYNHEKIKFLPWTGDLNRIAKFVNTCDALIHARSDGEIFSLSVADFSIRNKPVITWDGHSKAYDRGHIFLLKDKGIYYTNENDLLNILMNLDKKTITVGNWNVYNDTYSPQNIMKEFERTFIK